jgi:pimeloyl-ACP methyl ester carboxylesterase
MRQFITFKGLKMKTLSFLTAGLLALSASAFAETQTSVVLVHGAFADGSSWNKVINQLQKQHTEVIAVQLPLTSLKDDVAATQRAIARAQGNVVLVGHSWGGTVISEAGNDARVKSLVYVAAFALTPGNPPGTWWGVTLRRRVARTLRKLPTGICIFRQKRSAMILRQT